MKSIILIIFLVGATAKPTKKKIDYNKLPIEVPDKPFPVASPSHFEARYKTGASSYGYVTKDHYKVEVRQPDGTVEGVYGSKLPNGKSYITSYIADSNGGFRIVNNDVLEKVKKDGKLYDEFLEKQEKEKLEKEAESKPAAEKQDLPHHQGTHPQRVARKFVLPSGDSSQDYYYDKPYSYSFSGPYSVAVAGEYGMAKASGEGTAVAGPLEIAFAMPQAYSLAGSKGSSVAAPVATAIAGPGGIAIANPIAQALVGITDMSQLPKQQSLTLPQLGRQPTHHQGLHLLQGSQPTHQVPHQQGAQPSHQAPHQQGAQFPAFYLPQQLAMQLPPAFRQPHLDQKQNKDLSQQLRQMVTQQIKLRLPQHLRSLL